MAGKDSLKVWADILLEVEMRSIIVLVVFGS